MSFHQGTTTSELLKTMRIRAWDRLHNAPDNVILFQNEWNQACYFALMKYDVERLYSAIISFMS